MFHFRYKKLFDIRFRHPYYTQPNNPGNRRSADFDFVPTASTADLIRKYDLRLGKEKGRLEILQRQDFTIQGQWEDSTPLEEIIHLFFMIRVTSDIMKITDLKGLPEQYWLSNMDTNGDAIDFLTTNQQGLSAGDILKSTVTSKSLQLSFTKGQYSQFEISRFEGKLPGGQSPWKAFSTLQIDPEEESRTILFPSPGRYKITKTKDDSSKEETEYLFDDTLANSGTYFGILHLQLDANNKALKEYRINLPQKSNFWRYAIIVEEADINDYIDNNGNPIFYVKYDNAGASNYPVSNSITFSLNSNQSMFPAPSFAPRSIFLFESNDKIPLFEGTPPKIILEIGTQNNTNHRKIPLPVPNRQSVNSTIFYNIKN
jgi:hypothetical protein